MAGKRRKKKNKSLKRITVLCVMLLLVCSIMATAVYFIDKLIEEKTYKLDYKEEVLKYSEKYELDPILVFSIMHCESTGNKEAVSIKGARGLMQIMPETGEWIAHKLNIENYTEDMLLDQNINIEMGCWYLKFLKERFDDVFVNYVAAYNAGHGKVESWLKDERYSKDGVLTDIPYIETREYVVKVENAMEKYGEIYEAELDK